MWGRIFVIIRKEILETLREPRMRAVLFGPPMLQLLIFGYAVNLDVELSPIAWMDQDRTTQSRELLSEFEGSRKFEVSALPQNDREVQELLDRGQVYAVVRVLPGFGREVLRGQTTGVQILIDGSNSNTASIVSSYVNQTVALYSRKLQARRWDSDGDLPVASETRVWFNEDLRSQNYFVPGVVVNIIALVTIMLTSMSIVREREIGTMEQLMVTPIRPVELMLGKTLPFAMVALLELAFVTTMALLVFRIPFRGNPLLLVACALVFLLATLGTGLLISTVSGTQQQALMGSFVFFMPAFMLSGFSFPIQNMPVAVQYLSLLDPIRYFMQIVRAIFLKGSGFNILWPEILSLLLLGTAVVAISVLRFQKRLD